MGAVFSIYRSQNSLNTMSYVERKGKERKEGEEEVFGTLLSRGEHGFRVKLDRIENRLEELVWF